MFETERCLINTIEAPDYTDVKNLYGNDEVRKFLGGIRSDNSIKEVFADMLNSGNDSFYWVVREKHTDNFIGLVSLDLTTKKFTLNFHISFYRNGGEKVMRQKLFNC